AFTEMRARGANVTDVAVLVVAADDGPMPQTEEAINHARAAEVPIIVAINKIDLGSANPQRCKEQLSGLGLNPVEWGGDTEMVEVSAQTGEGLDNLLEVLSLESEILELKADPERSALGVVLEAEATTHRGVLTTALIKDGSLKLGDSVLAGASYGRVKDLLINGTEQVSEAGPSMPVTLVGLNSVPDAGEKLYVLESEKQARQIADSRARSRREMEQAEKSSGKRRSLIDLVEKTSRGETTELNLILKADVRGSIEALRSSLVSLSTEEVRVEIIHTGVGAVSQEDVQLASASDAVIIGFHVVADDRARVVAEENGIEIRYYKVIYEAIDDVHAAMEARLAPEEVEEFHGEAEIREVFKASKLGNIAGCYVKTGKILRNDKIRLVRNDVEIHEGSIANLKRLKDDTKEVKEGFECGIKLKNYEDIKKDDLIRAYAIVHKARTLEK
ncbi:MAG: translation initiation factor IF-2, partial [Planctomycetota bacterium]